MKFNLLKKRTLLIAGISVIGISIAFVTINIQKEMFQFEIMGYEGPPKAVIIDQLDNDYPNEEFQNKVTEYLRSDGYKVDLVTTDEITVDFYKKLPSMNYKYIVIRGHSLGDGAIKEIDSATLFTGEKHDYHKYIKEQFQGHVGMGVPYLYSDVERMGGFQSLLNQTYFVFGSELIDELMIGTFPNSTIILAGCETTKRKALADSFLNRGASEVIGWNGLIGFRNNDWITMRLLNETLVNDVEIKEAINEINESYDGKLVYKTALVYRSASSK